MKFYARFVVQLLLLRANESLLPLQLQQRINSNIGASTTDSLKGGIESIRGPIHWGADHMA